MIIQRKYHFYAGHRNKEAGEKCGRLHGHTYDVVIHVRPKEIKNGIGMLFSDIDFEVEPILKYYDHWLLLYEKDPLCEMLDLANEPYLAVPFETSAENLAVWLFNRIKNETKVPIIKIELAETKSSNIVYENNN